MEELISVIVPVYKVEQYLGRCIESIQNQTYRNLEIILVDDGSPDQCGQICDNYMQNDSRIRVIHKTNGGLSDARNAGIQIARGNYLGFIDSDDYIAPDMFAHLYQLLVDNKADISICSAVVVSEDGQAEFTNGDLTKVLTGEDILSQMIYRNLFTVNTWNKLYKRNLFDNIRFPKGMLYEDLATTYKLMDISDCVVCSNAQKYAYVQRSGSIMNQTGLKMNPDKVEILSEMWQYFTLRKKPFTNEIKAGVIRYAVNDIFRMMGSRNLMNNLPYWTSFKKFMKGKTKGLFQNPCISLYHKLVLVCYLCNPAILSFVYKMIKREESAK